MSQQWRCRVKGQGVSFCTPARNARQLLPPSFSMARHVADVSGGCATPQSTSLPFWVKIMPITKVSQSPDSRCAVSTCCQCGVTIDMPATCTKTKASLAQRGPRRISAFRVGRGIPVPRPPGRGPYVHEVSLPQGQVQTPDPDRVPAEETQTLCIWGPLPGSLSAGAPDPTSGSAFSQGRERSRLCDQKIQPRA